MNYDWLHSFTRFAQHLNFTKSAAELHISQPALHVQVKKLAEAVGRPLYRRHGGTLVLTSEGKRLAAYGREVQERGQAMLAELRGHSHKGPVVLAAGQGAFLYMLGAAIQRFPKDRWPLRLMPVDAAKSIEAVRDATAHLCVVATNAPPEDLMHVLLRSVGQQVVVPRAHRLAAKRTVTLADLTGEQMVVAPAGSPHRLMLQELMARSNLTLPVAVEAAGWELMIHFAKCKVGLAVVNDFCALPDGLVGIPLKDAPRIEYHLLSRDGPVSMGVRVMKELIEKVAAK